MNLKNDVIRDLRELTESEMTETEFLRSVENNMIPMQQFFT